MTLADSEDFWTTFTRRFPVFVLCLITFLWVDKYLSRRKQKQDEQQQLQPEPPKFLLTCTNNTVINASGVPFHPSLPLYSPEMSQFDPSVESAINLMPADYAFPGINLNGTRAGLAILIQSAMYLRQFNAENLLRDLRKCSGTPDHPVLTSLENYIEQKHEKPLTVTDIKRHILTEDKRDEVAAGVTADFYAVFACEDVTDNASLVKFLQKGAYLTPYLGIKNLPILVKCLLEFSYGFRTFPYKEKLLELSKGFEDFNVFCSCLLLLDLAKLFPLESDGSAAPKEPADSEEEIRKLWEKSKSAFEEMSNIVETHIGDKKTKVDSNPAGLDETKKPAETVKKEVKTEAVKNETKTEEPVKLETVKSETVNTEKPKTVKQETVQPTKETQTTEPQIDLNQYKYPITGRTVSILHFSNGSSFPARLYTRGQECMVSEELALYLNATITTNREMPFIEISHQSHRRVIPNRHTRLRFVMDDPDAPITSWDFLVAPEPGTLLLGADFMGTHQLKIVHAPKDPAVTQKDLVFELGEFCTRPLRTRSG